ncbi:MAG: hypothetical protein AAF841_05585 [Pseudomonadota bacterium]
MKVLVLILAMAAGIVFRNEGCAAERIAWEAVQGGSILSGATWEI